MGTTGLMPWQIANVSTGLFGVQGQYYFTILQTYVRGHHFFRSSFADFTTDLYHHRDVLQCLSNDYMIKEHGLSVPFCI